MVGWHHQLRGHGFEWAAGFGDGQGGLASMASQRVGHNRVTELTELKTLLSCVQLFTTPWTAACRASLSITNSWSLIKLMSIKSVMPSNNLILCYLLLLPASIFPRIKIFSNESVLHIRWPKYWSFSFSEYSGLISSMIDWLDLLAVQETLKSLLRYHGSKASVLWCSAFFVVQLSPL